MEKRKIAKVNYAALAACEFRAKKSARQPCNISSESNSLIEFQEKKGLIDIKSIDSKLSTDFIDTVVKSKYEELKPYMFMGSTNIIGNNFDTNVKKNTELITSEICKEKYSTNVKSKNQEIKQDFIVVSSKQSAPNFYIDMKTKNPESITDAIIAYSPTSPLKCSIDIKPNNTKLKSDFIVVPSKMSPDKFVVDVKAENVSMGADSKTFSPKTCQLSKNFDIMKMKYALKPTFMKSSNKKLKHSAPQSSIVAASKYSALEKTFPIPSIATKKHPIIVKLTNPLWKQILADKLRVSHEPSALETKEKHEKKANFPCLKGCTPYTSDQPNYFISVQAVSKNTDANSQKEKKSSWICERCNRVLRSKPSAIQRHQLTCYSTLSCDLCNSDGFVSLNLLERHNLSEHFGGLSRYPCVFCQRTFSQSHFLRGHVYNEHRIVWLLKVPFRLDVHCRSCGHEFDTASALAQHLNLKRSCCAQVRLLRLPIDYIEQKDSLISEAIKQSEQSAQQFPGKTRFADVTTSVFESQPQGGAVRVQLRVMVEQKHSDIKRPVPIVFQAYAPARLEPNSPALVPLLNTASDSSSALSSLTPEPHSLDQQLQCIVCDQMFETIAQLKTHSEEHLMQLSEHHQPSSNSFKKPKCSKKCDQIDVSIATQSVAHELKEESITSDQMLTTNDDENHDLKSKSRTANAVNAQLSTVGIADRQPICLPIPTPVKKARLIRSSLERQLEHEKLKTQTKRLNRIKAKVCSLRCFDCDQMFETAAMLKSHSQVHLKELVDYQQALICSTISRSGGGGVAADVDENAEHHTDLMEQSLSHKRPPDEDLLPCDAKKMRCTSNLEIEPVFSDHLHSRMIEETSKKVTFVKKQCESDENRAVFTTIASSITGATLSSNDPSIATSSTFAIATGNNLGLTNGTVVTSEIVSSTDTTVVFTSSAQYAN